jgi:hypothetical protein
VVVLLLVLVVFGVVSQIIRAAVVAPPPPPTSTGGDPPSAVTRPTRDERAVISAVAAVERAFNAGDVTTLCHPGALVDGAVVGLQNSLPGGCEAELEGLMAADASPLRLTVRGLILRQALATAVVSTSRGAQETVDLVRGPHGWLLSFSGGDDPMPALAGGAATAP